MLLQALGAGGSALRQQTTEVACVRRGGGSVQGWRHEGGLADHGRLDAWEGC